MAYILYQNFTLGSLGEQFKTKEQKGGKDNETEKHWESYSQPGRCCWLTQGNAVDTDENEKFLVHSPTVTTFGFFVD